MSGFASFCVVHLLLTVAQFTGEAPPADPAPLPPAPGGEDVVVVDRQAREVRVVAQVLHVDMPLEFVCVLAGTQDHETLLRTTARPGDIHAALVSLGVQPGSPVRFVPGRKTWLPPSGPPVRVDVEWTDGDGNVRREGVHRMLRNLETGRPMPETFFVFAGSRVLDDGTYGADVTGQILSVVNFEYSTLDVPYLASHANETLEWETDPTAAPPEGTIVTMILQPVGDDEVPAVRDVPDAEPAPGVAPDATPVVLVSVSRAGDVRVGELESAVVEAGTMARRQLPDGVGRVRLTVERGTPVEAVGGVLARLVSAELTDVVFAPPPPGPDEEPADPSDLRPWTIHVGEGGQSIDLEADDTRRPMMLARLVEFLAESARDEANLTRRVVVRAGAEGLHPVDLAAPAAALHALGYRSVKVESTRDDADPFDTLRRRWEQEVLPQGEGLRRAAQTHYEVMQAYEREINRLLDEAEQLRRDMDALQQRYNDLTTPRPSSGN